VAREWARTGVAMRIATATAFSLLLCACAPEPPKELSTQELRAQLLSYRDSSEACDSDSPECRDWTLMALKCEENLANGVRGTDCTKAEEFRELMTGVMNSSDAGAYRF